MELCREVGKSFEAVRSSTSTQAIVDGERKGTGSPDCVTGFSAIISGLEEKNRELVTEVSHLKQAALENTEARQRLEEGKKISEAELWAARTEIERLRKEKSNLHSQTKKYSRKLLRSENEIRVAFHAIQRSGLNIGLSAPGKKEDLSN